MAKRCYRARRAARVVALVWALAPLAANAEQGFSAHGLRVRPNRQQGYVATSSARVVGAWGWSVGVVAGHAVRPLAVDPGELTSAIYVPNGRLVTSQTVTELVAAVGIADFLELGVAAPLVLRQEGDDLAGLADPAGLETGVGMSDVWLVPKATVFGLGSPDYPALALAVETAVGLPTGDRVQFRGGGLQVEPRLILEGRIPGGPALSANLGYAWRDAVEIPGLKTGAGPLWAVGLDVPVTSGLSATVEAFHTTSTEALLACHLGLGRARIEVGGGIGLTDDAGTPDWRALVGLSLGVGGAAPEGLYLRDAAEEPSPPAPALAAECLPPQAGPARSSCDTDQDRIADVEDRCPSEAEDFDGFEDEDGCLDADNDGDGVDDLDDRCPMDPFSGANLDWPGCPPGGGRRGIDTIVYYAPFSDRLSTMAKHSLDVVAATLIESPAMPHVWVIGHSDVVDNRKYEQDLSLHRAEACRAHLIEAGVAAERVTAIGLGAAALLAAPNEDRVLNRRVEFRVAGADEPPPAAPIPEPPAAPIPEPPAVPSPRDP